MSGLEYIEIVLVSALVVMALWFGTMALASILTALVRHQRAALWHIFAVGAAANLAALIADSLAVPVWVIFAAVWVAIQAAALSIRETISGRSH